MLLSGRHFPKPSFGNTDELKDFNSESIDEVAIVASDVEDVADQESLNGDKNDVSTVANQPQTSIKELFVSCYQFNHNNPFAPHFREDKIKKPSFRSFSYEDFE